MKPATPLPWNIVGDQKSGAIVKAGDGIASHVAKYNDQWVCEEHGNEASDAAFRNAAYIVHAANAYPRLVAALRRTHARLAAYGTSDAADQALALLRELGEVAQ